jgi:uncharacterized protein (TIGR02118 family)
MIRISVMYPNENGKRFDWDYYTNKHIPAAKQLTPLGLIRIEVEKGIGSAQPGAMAPYVAMAHLYFNTMEDMLRCQSQSGDSMADIPNFTDIQPQIQIGEIL